MTRKVAEPRHPHVISRPEAADSQAGSLRRVLYGPVENFGI